MYACSARLDATQDDLGCGMSWASMHRVRPRAPLTCPECGQSVQAKVSPGRLRFFAHDRTAATCALSRETLEHHLLKLELTTAVREAGWYATLEVSSTPRTWRADVLATSPDGSSRMAWEAQLSPITIDDIAERTAKFRADGVPVCWTSTVDRPWLGAVPSVLVKSPPHPSNPWSVRAGIVQFTEAWVPSPTLTLLQFVDWVLSGRLVAHALQRELTLSTGFWRSVWTTPADIVKAVSYRDRVAAFVRQVDRQPASVRARRTVAPQDDPTAEPYTEPPVGFLGQVRDHLNTSGVNAGQIEIRDQRDPQLANGYPVYLLGRLTGVACPCPDQPSQWADLYRLVVFVPASQISWFSRVAPLGTKMQVIRPPA
jgi:competence protein CoiA